MTPKNCIAIRGGFFLGLIFASLAAFAGQVAGTVSDLNGPLLAKKADGTVKILSQKSVVEQGDLLVTEKETYARIKFLDDSEVTLQPNTQFKIDSFSYAQDKPQNDNWAFSLLKGGLRAITGLVGKRSRERVTLSTPAATIGIRGTTYIAEYIPLEQSEVATYGRASMASAASWMTAPSYATLSDAQIVDAPLEILPRHTALPLPLLTLAQLAPPAGGSLGVRQPGLYVQVLDGLITLNNQGGSLNFSAGQFGYAPNFTQPPVVVPNNPGMQFAPPPAFSSSSSARGGSGGSINPGSIDCEVR